METTRRMVAVDGNEAAASVAYRASEVVAIYPITPSSPMGEFSDEWSAKAGKNLWGTVPSVTEMQSEGGAAGAVHGALQAGALCTTFTASQGLLLMIPNMYKIAGELTSFVMHVTARTLATHALSIFGDHSDVMACRQTGFALLASGSVQEAHDLAAVAHAATLRSRVPFMHFFDGFRTSHEVAKIAQISDEELGQMLPEELVEAHRARALTPDRPVLRGTAQNPDVFFQCREACNSFYDACPGLVQAEMDRFAAVTGRKYKLFDYVGAPDATKVIVIMGSGAEVAHETVEHLIKEGQQVGVLKVRLYRPFSAAAFIDALPATTKSIAVLDRTKEPGAGDPLFLDVVAALAESERFETSPTVIAGRYGLSSKEFTPAMVKAVYAELSKFRPRKRFTVGINDDVTKLSLEVDQSFDIEPAEVTRAMFFGLGADGTVGANKNSIKIIGEQTDNYAQGYFVYDSKKSGTMTVSHLRFGPGLIRSSYLIRQANFIACHQFGFLEKQDVLKAAAPGAVFLLNSPYAAEKVWDQIPAETQKQIVDRKLKFYVIDADSVAVKLGLPGRINTIMQACFFAISGVLPREDAIKNIKKAITKTYGRKGEEVVKKNHQAVDIALENLFEVKVPTVITGKPRAAMVADNAPEFVKKVTAEILAGRGDDLPVSVFANDGTWPLGTTKWEKRAIAAEIPVWEPALCIQCNKCALACPHAAIRPKVVSPTDLLNPPGTFKSMPYKGQEYKGMSYCLQVAPEDCTGCNVCVEVCPAKDKTSPNRKAINMEPLPKLRAAEVENWDYFLKLPNPDRKGVKGDVKGSQFLEPLFEFSGACSGCGETPYVKLLTQLYGDRMMVANATGCSSIYGGNLPTTPYAVDAEGRGPAWSNSLFEDNAEFGLGMRLALDKHEEQAKELLVKLAGEIGQSLVDSILATDQSNEGGIAFQRRRVGELRARLAAIPGADAKRLGILADYLVKKSVWIIGGDGWAYDIGFGGLDHVLSSGRNVNILVLDTEVYSNTGGQQSKATPMGAAAKFAAAGKATHKKDLGLIAMAYGSVYVARVAFGAKDVQTVKAIQEAEAYPGVSLIIAYSHCIAHGYDLAKGPEHQKLAVDSAYWPLYRFDPRRAEAGEVALQLDSTAPKIGIGSLVQEEIRFRTVERANPERFKALMTEAQRHVHERFAMYERLAGKGPSTGSGQGAAAAAATESAANGKNGSGNGGGARVSAEEGSAK